MIQRRFLSLGVLAFFLWAAPGWAATNAPPLAPQIPDISFSILRVVGALALVIGLFLGGVWCYRNWQRLVVRGGRSPRLNVLEVKSLGGRHALYLVSCDDQRLLLATSPAGVGLLTHLPDDDGETPGEIGVAPSFSQSLKRAENPTK